MVFKQKATCAQRMLHKPRPASISLLLLPHSPTCRLALWQWYKTQPALPESLQKSKGQPCSSPLLLKLLPRSCKLLPSSTGLLMLHQSLWSYMCATCYPCPPRNTSYLLLYLPLRSCQLLKSAAKWQIRRHFLVFSSSLLWGLWLLLLLAS